MTENKSLLEIANLERDMVLEANKKYGEFFKNSLDANYVLNNFAESINNPNHWILLSFFSSLKKHHMLSILSSVRLHLVQTDMNLRQVLEATSWMAYAFEYQDEKLFQNNDKCKQTKYKWLDDNYSFESNDLISLKKMINKNTAHSHLDYTLMNLDVNIENDAFNTPFFDIDKKGYAVKTQLLHIATIGIMVVSFCFKLNQKYNILQINTGLLDKLKDIEKRNKALKQMIINDNPHIKQIIESKK